jgi:hypothetical protein
MRIALLALLLVCLVGTVTPAASAEIVEVTTWVAVPASATDEEMKDAMRAAAREAVADTGVAQPAMVVVTAAFVSAGRLCVRFLIADEAGARQLGVHENGRKI